MELDLCNDNNWSVMQPHQKKHADIGAPVSLGGLFVDDDSDGETPEDGFQQVFEEKEIAIGECSLTIRQYAWHMANANKVWPGTFNLAEFLCQHEDRYISSSAIVELGAATGALSIFLKKRYPHISLITSDIDDGGDVQTNIAYNFTLNDLEAVPHVAHTWGAGWPWELPATETGSLTMRYVIGSDILLYVSAYPSLVQTLKELFAGRPPTTSDGVDCSDSAGDGRVREFVMSWNRRIAESNTFFELMRAEGFHCHHHGACVYSFYLDAAVATDFESFSSQISKK